MTSAAAFNQAIGGLAVRNLNVALLAQMLQHQQVAGAAMVEMIEGSAPSRSQPPPPQITSEAPPPAPPPSVPEPGTGQLVDIVA